MANQSDDIALVVEALRSYISAAEGGDGPVLRQMPIRQLSEELKLEALTKEGGLSGAQLSAFLQTYLDNASRMQHPLMMGHQVSCPHPSSILGGYIDSCTNNPMGIYEKGAPAAAIEYHLINWMLQKVGWRPTPYPGEAENEGGGHHGAGVLTHGGSLAQLTALAGARSHADPDIWRRGNNPDLVVIAPQGSHYSIARAMGILGMGTRALVEAPCDDQGRLRPQELQALLQQTEDKGLEVMAVVANACSTAVGLYDPLDEIGQLCNETQTWFHVDGAHGAGALLSDKYRHLMKGVARADSMIWDAHKMMRTTGLCAAVLFKDHIDMQRTFAQEASYLFHDKDQPGVDLIDRTVECTKAGLGLKFFMGLAAQGETGLGAYITSRYDLALDVADFIEQHPRFELAVQPEANIICFRVSGLDDDAQLQLRKRLLASEQGLISTTGFMHKRWLRLTLMNPATGLQHVQQLLEQLLALADELDPRDANQR